MKRGSVRRDLKIAFVHFAMSTLLVAALLALYMFGSNVRGSMDVYGWLFFVASCISHATCLLAVPLLLFYLPLVLLGRGKWGGVMMTLAVSLLAIALFVDMQVYALYKFHVNGFVINMFLGPASDEIFVFDKMLYLKEGSIFLLLIAACVGIALAARRWWAICSKTFVWCVVGLMLTCTAYAHVWHIYASFKQLPSTMKCTRLLPYYFPMTAYSLLNNMGVEQWEMLNGQWSMANGDDIVYPLHPMDVNDSIECPNIVLILIDSWNKRALTQECMPCTYSLAQSSQWFQNHRSCSNGTRGSVFGLMFGIPTYYWELFEPNHISPLLMDRMLELGYDIQAYTGATLTDPPFHRVIFHRIPDIRLETDGDTPFDRDRQLAHDFIESLPQHAADGRPFFSFLFFDLAHSMSLSKEQNGPFKPAWDYADYTRLNNELDATPFFNLYRNCCHHVDGWIGEVVAAIKTAGLDENTVIIVSGDHAQEFNENKKNYWGHNGNFSVWQTGIPMILNYPGVTPQQYFHRTTHYDVVPTLMNGFLGVRNPSEDYSMGHLLTDTISRTWHFMGSERNYAFIMEGDTILEKMPDGAMEVTDAQLNPVNGYAINPQQFTEAIQRLNRFMKK